MNIAHRLLDTISVAAPTGVNNSGELTYAAAVTQAARVEAKTQIVQMPDGTFIQTNTQILTLTAIPTQARIWLAGQSTSDVTLARTPQRVESMSTLDGTTTHYLISL